MSIGEIITAIGGSAVLFAVIGWLAREIILHLLSKDVEAFKAKLQMESQRELAQLKSSIELAAFEHQIRFSRLHEKRAEIIGELYARIVDLHEIVSDFVRRFQSVDDSKKEEKLKQLWNAAGSFIDYFEKHRIYFERDICEKVIRLKEKLSEACSILASFVQGREVIKLSYDQLYEAWDKAMTMMEQEVPEVRSILEERFRELLGVPQSINKSQT